ncbi:hypothetical protein QJQ45_028552, partial [Haematococcus lacustris]
AQGCSAYVERVAAAAYTGVAQQATALLAADRPPGPQGAGAAAQPVLSRPVVLCALRLVRDLASACTREASLRWAGRPQGGRGRSAGLPDLTHLLAVLTALLRELDLLQHLVDLHRAAEEAGAAPAALEPLLETVVAAAACFSRPGQPPTLPAARSSNGKGPHSPGPTALPGPVLKFLVDELALVTASVTNEVALYAGLPYPQLPHSLQGSLKVLHHLVRSVVVFGAVSSPQRRSLSPEGARRPAAPPAPPAAVGPLLAAAAAASQPGPLLAPRVAVQAGSGQGSRPGSARPQAPVCCQSAAQRSAAAGGAGPGEWQGGRRGDGCGGARVEELPLLRGNRADSGPEVPWHQGLSQAAARAGPALLRCELKHWNAMHDLLLAVHSHHLPACLGGIVDLSASACPLAPARCLR